MEPPKRAASNQKVFRDEIKEHRGSYYVIYKPADVRLPFASVQLVFPESSADITAVRLAMEQELMNWLNRFPVPVMVSSFNAKDELIRISNESDESHLMGYIDPRTGGISLRWGLFENDELPSEQMDADYLERVYNDVPFRLQEEVRQKAEREARVTGRAIRLIVFLTVVVPVLIEVVSLGVTWLGHLLASLSISAGIYKIGKAMGWLNPTKRDKQKAEKDLKMRHYFYHCELNPDAFNRLRAENFEREAIERTRKEAEALRKGSK